MSVIIRLQGLPWTASSLDIRNFFQGLSIPPGGVHIIGGNKGEAFIAFSTDEDARKAMMFNFTPLNGSVMQLFLSSKSEMQTVIEQAQTPSDQPATTNQAYNPSADNNEYNPRDRGSFRQENNYNNFNQQDFANMNSRNDQYPQTGRYDDTSNNGSYGRNIYNQNEQGFDTSHQQSFDNQGHLSYQDQRGGYNMRQGYMGFEKDQSLPYSAGLENEQHQNFRNSPLLTKPVDANPQYPVPTSLYQDPSMVIKPFKPDVEIILSSSGKESSPKVEKDRSSRERSSKSDRSERDSDRRSDRDRSGRDRDRDRERDRDRDRDRSRGSRSDRSDRDRSDRSDRSERSRWSDRSDRDRGREIEGKSPRDRSDVRRPRDGERADDKRVSDSDKNEVKTGFGRTDKNEPGNMASNKPNIEGLMQSPAFGGFNSQDQTIFTGNERPKPLMPLPGNFNTRLGDKNPVMNRFGVPQDPERDPDYRSKQMMKPKNAHDSWNTPIDADFRTLDKSQEDFDSRGEHFSEDQTSNKGLLGDAPVGHSFPGPGHQEFLGDDRYVRNPNFNRNNPGFNPENLGRFRDDFPNNRNVQGFNRDGTTFDNLNLPAGGGRDGQGPRNNQGFVSNEGPPFNKRDGPAVGFGNREGAGPGLLNREVPGPGYGNREGYGLGNNESSGFGNRDGPRPGVGPGFGIGDETGFGNRGFINRDRPGFGNREGPGYGNREEQGFGNREGPGFGNKEGPGFGNREGPGFGNREGPGFGNREGPGFGNREGPGFGNREGPGFGNREGPGFGNREGPGFGNREGPGFGNREGPGFGNREGPGFGNREGPGFGKREGPGYGNEEQIRFGNREGPGVGNREGPGYGNREGPGFRNRGPGFGNREESGFGNRDGPSFGNRGGPGLGNRERPAFGDREGPGFGNRTGPGFRNREGLVFENRDGPGFDQRAGPGFGNREGSAPRSENQDNGPGFNPCDGPRFGSRNRDGQGIQAGDAGASENTDQNFARRGGPSLMGDAPIPDSLNRPGPGFNRDDPGINRNIHGSNFSRESLMNLNPNGDGSTGILGASPKFANAPNKEGFGLMGPGPGPVGLMDMDQRGMIGIPGRDVPPHRRPGNKQSIEPVTNPTDALVKPEMQIYAHLKNLPYSATLREIRNFFQGSEITMDGIKLLVDDKGRKIGTGYIEFKTEEDLEKALKKFGEFFESRRMIITKCSQFEFLSAVDGVAPVAKRPRWEGEGHPPINEPKFLVYMKGFPKHTVKEDIWKFFVNCRIADNGNGIYFDHDGTGKLVGLAFIEFENHRAMQNALQFNGTMIGPHRIEVGPSHPDELSAMFRAHKSREMEAASKRDTSRDSHDREKANDKNRSNSNLKDSKVDVKNENKTKKEDIKSGDTCVILKNLPRQIKQKEIEDFFRGIKILDNCIKFVCNEKGDTTDVGYVEFKSTEDCRNAIKKSGSKIGHNALKVESLSKSSYNDKVRDLVKKPMASPIKKETKEEIKKDSDPEVTSSEETPVAKSIPAGVLRQHWFYLRCKNFPETVTIGEMLKFFSGYDPIPESIRLHYSSDGKPTGNAVIGFPTKDISESALKALNNQMCRNNKVEIFLA